LTLFGIVPDFVGGSAVDEGGEHRDHVFRAVGGVELIPTIMGWQIGDDGGHNMTNELSEGMEGLKPSDCEEVSE